MPQAELADAPALLRRRRAAPQQIPHTPVPAILARLSNWILMWTGRPTGTGPVPVSRCVNYGRPVRKGSGPLNGKLRSATRGLRAPKRETPLKARFSTDFTRHPRDNKHQSLAASADSGARRKLMASRL